MSESAATVVYMTVAATLMTTGSWKVSILLRHPAPALALQTAAHLLGAIVYVVASPWGYRKVGSALGQPWFPTLPIYLGILLCFGTMHMLTILWTPAHPDQPQRTRRSITAWALAYTASMMIMSVAFLSADLDGPADPLKFNTEQADEPHVMVFLGVFLFMLGCGTLTASRRSWRARPDDETIMHALRWYSASHLTTFGYVACSAPAVVAAALGHNQLDAVGVLGAAFGSVGTLMLCYGITGAAASKWLAERRDIAVLQPLWELVGVDQELSLGTTRHRSDGCDSQESASSPRSQPSRLFNIRWTLHRRVIEILDGIRQLEQLAWVRNLPAQAVVSLHREAMRNDALRSQLNLRKKGLSQAEREAAATAAVLRDAVERLHAAGPDGAAPRATGPAVSVPGKKTPAIHERRRLVLVARALQTPLVDRSLQVVRSVHDTEGAPQDPAAAR